MAIEVLGRWSHGISAFGTRSDEGYIGAIAGGTGVTEVVRQGKGPGRGKDCGIGNGALPGSGLGPGV